MNRLPSACMKSLLAISEAAKRIPTAGTTTHSQQSKIWSLHALIQLTNDFASDVNVRKTVADTLLKDVKLRLAQQHGLCLAMKKAIQDSDVLDHSGQNEGNSQIIPARMNLAFAAPKDILLYRKRSLKIVDDLEAMHADTYRLIWQLYNKNINDQLKTPKILTNFTPANESLISGLFEQIRSRHAHSVDSLAHLVVSHRKLVDSNLDSNMDNIMRICSSFLQGRLVIQLLCDHYVGMHKQTKTNRSKETELVMKHGSVSIGCNLWTIVKDAVAEASAICETNMGTTPEVYVVSNKTDEKYNISMADKYLVSHPITLVQPWVHHCLVEVLKNGMQACAQKNFREPSPLVITINSDESYTYIRIRDYGVGLDNFGISKAFEFAVTGQSKELWDRLQHQQSYAAVTTPLSGLGVGLPLSKMMLEMFGGSLHLEPINDGKGGLASIISLNTNLNHQFG